MAAMHKYPRTSASKLGLVAGATVLAALVVFLAGRFTGDAAPSRGEGRGSGSAATAGSGWASEPTRPADPGRTGAPSGAPNEEPSPPGAAAFSSAAAPAEIPAPGQSPAAVATTIVRATAETRQQLEASKRDLIEKCWPAKGLPGGRTSARLSFSVAYDAYGREVGRAVGEGRQSPTGELRTCLGRLPLGMLRISPPGSSVSVKVALNLP
jgi:hypothetical protein